MPLWHSRWLIFFPRFRLCEIFHKVLESFSYRCYWLFTNGFWPQSVTSKVWVNSNIMLTNKRNVWLSRFAFFTVFSTLSLISLGGVVTSTESGMTVPDWPNSYGYNMFLFPISLWQGGIFYEHSHRLLGSFVGLLTIVLAVWSQISPKVDTITRRMAWIAIPLVIFQGILGGLRVELVKDWIGIFHAVVAQCYLVYLAIIAFRISAKSRTSSPDLSAKAVSRVSAMATFLSIAVLLQLTLGATMRHQHQGLAVPDFPAAYGKVWPDTSPASMAEINEIRSFNDQPEVSTFHVWVHMGHRFFAYFILLAGTFCVFLGISKKWFDRMNLSKIYPIVWCCLLWSQGLLGVVTVLKNKPADIATLHVIVGAFTLVSVSLLAYFSTLTLTLCQKDALTSQDTIPQTHRDKQEATISTAA